MNVSLVGINHRTTPIAIREKVAISAEKFCDSLSLLRHYVPHGIILSTCNRTEVYTMDSHPAEEAGIDFLNAMTGVSFTDLLPHIYLCKNETAFRYLFRVASGLDSMIVGEFEILGQIGHALEVAEQTKMVNLPLRHIFQSAIRAGRRVREETEISKNALSISSVAVEMATEVVGDLGDCKMLVIGTGEAGRLVAKAAKERGTSRIVIASRTQERASALAVTLGGIPISVNNIAEELSTCNIVVNCTSAPRRILDFHRIEVAMKTRPEFPLVIIDIGVPRNVEPTAGQINNVFLYNIDDFTQISDRNRKQRESEVQKAKEIIATEMVKLTSWWWALEVRPVVSALMRKAEDIRSAQLSKTLKKLRPLSDEERDNLEAMSKSIVTKILRDPIRCLKTNINNNDYAEIVNKLFQLDKEERE